MFLDRSPTAIPEGIGERRQCFVRLLGGFQVEIDGRPVPAEAWRHRRAADIVKLLALDPRRRLHRDQVMEALWPELKRDAAAANLRKAIHFARQTLGSIDAISGERDLVSLWPRAALRVDLHEFTAAAEEALATGEGVDAAARLFTGDVLPEDRYAEWSEPHRERARERCLELLRKAGRWNELLAIDRSDEEAHRALMRGYLQAGNRQAAIRQFQRLREILRVDLGVGPAPETVSLFEEALAMHGPGQADPAEHAQALIARGLVRWSQRELDEAERWAEEARTIALGAHLGRELGEASALLGLVAWARGRWPERFRQEFMQTLPLGPEQAPFVLDAHLCLAEASIDGADSSAVAALARELLPEAEKAGSTAGTALMNLLIGECALAEGSFEESHASLSRAEMLYEGIGGVSGRAFATIRLAEAETRHGHGGVAIDLLLTARRLAQESELTSHLMVRVFAGVLRASNQPERQLAAIAEAERALPPKEICRPCSIGYRVAATMALAAAGETARARRALQDAERLAGIWQGGPWQAAVWEARAAVRLAEREREQAAALLREAADLFAQHGRLLDRARCIEAAGRLKSAASSPAG